MYPQSNLNRLDIKNHVGKQYSIKTNISLNMKADKK